MRHGSIFSGIGGFDLAASWMGWENVFHCEKDRFCRSVLQYYWPEAESYEDIYRFDSTKFRGAIDIISGGFPCQPFSTAGKRKGTADDRYLWPQALRVIKEVRPTWVVLENVSGLFTILEPASLSEVEIKEVELFCSDEQQAETTSILRLQRRVIGTIISDLGAAGYLLPRLEDGTAIVLCIPACAVNAPHRRDRVWFIAYASGDGCSQYSASSKDDPGGYGQGLEASYESDALPYAGTLASPNDARLQKWATGNPTQKYKGVSNRTITGFYNAYDWQNWPTQSPLYNRNDGISYQLDGITLPRWRQESIKALGNAIVPEVALQIFEGIKQTESLGRK